MNRIIKEQLLKCKVAKIPVFNDTTTSLIISRNGKGEDSIISSPYSQLELNKKYIIKLEYYIIHPSDTFTLASNWNKGIVPKSEYMICTPIKFIGKMVQVDSTGYDIITNTILTDSYKGLWLPSKGIKIINQLGDSI